MSEAKYYRKRNVIRGPEGDDVCKSINSAKRKSRELQQSEGGLGCGVLQVVDKFPPEEDKDANI